jgi:hypothetical protein
MGKCKLLTVRPQGLLIKSFFLSETHYFCHRPRFQLNLILFREKAVPELSNMVEEIVMPFMWAEDGFGEPSEPMAAAIK